MILGGIIYDDWMMGFETTDDDGLTVMANGWAAASLRRLFALSMSVRDSMPPQGRGGPPGSSYVRKNHC